MSSVRNFSERTFVNALEEYTKRIDNSVSEIEINSEIALHRLFALFIFLILSAGALPIIVRFADFYQSSAAYTTFFQGTILFSVVAILALTAFTLYTRLLRLQRYRRNLETLLWPYKKLLQKLSQIIDHGDLDEGTSTLMQLKVLEAEVAYGRARRIVESQKSFASLLFPKRPQRFEPWEARQLADEADISLEEAERLLRRYWPDRDRARSVAMERYASNR